MLLTAIKTLELSETKCYKNIKKTIDLKQTVIYNSNIKKQNVI